MRITLEIDGEAQLDRAFNRVKGVIEDLTPVWKAVEGEFFDIEQEQFESEGGKGSGGKWQALSPKYAEVKSRLYGARGILYATGRLQKSLTRHTSDTVSEISKQAFAIGTKVPYAAYHQRGGKTPQRKPIDFSIEQKTRLTKSIQKELLKIIRKDKGLTVV